jgi:hypothetical protein
VCGTTKLNLFTLGREHAGGQERIPREITRQLRP